MARLTLRLDHPARPGPLPAGRGADAHPARRPWPTRPSAPSSPRSRRTPTRSRGRWARTSATPCSWPSAGSSSSPRGPAAGRASDGAGDRGRLPAGARRGPLRPEHGVAAGGVPGGRPGLLERDVREPARRRRGRRDAGQVRRPGLRLHRPALRGQRRRAHRRVGDHRPDARPAARVARQRAAPRRRRRPARARRRPGRLGAAGDADRASCWSRRTCAPRSAPWRRRRWPSADPTAEEHVVLLVPDATRAVLLRALSGVPAVVGPTRPWQQARASWRRARRALDLRDPGHRHRGAPGRAGGARRPRGPGRPAGAGAGTRWPTWDRPPGTSSPTRCAPGCCTRAGARRSPRRWWCTRRPCATGSGSSARRTATASTIPSSSGPRPSPWAERPHAGRGDRARRGHGEHPHPAGRPSRHRDRHRPRPPGHGHDQRGALRAGHPRRAPA